MECLVTTLSVLEFPFIAGPGVTGWCGVVQAMYDPSLPAAGAALLPPHHAARAGHFHPHNEPGREWFKSPMLTRSLTNHRPGWADHGPMAGLAAP